MRPPSPRTVTRLLRAGRRGSQESLDRALPLVYEELRNLARRHMRGERPGHTLQTTELVHEAYVRLAKSRIAWADRAHFFRVAATQMRRILVDHARARRSAKRGGDAVRLSLDEALVVAREPSPDLVNLDEALTRLARQDPRKGQVVELHLFGGLKYGEIAEVLGVSSSTVRLDMRFAKAWLQAELSRA